jgi:hypothetical protein
MDKGHELLVSDLDYDVKIIWEKKNTDVTNNICSSYWYKFNGNYNFKLSLKLQSSNPLRDAEAVIKWPLVSL